jgi:hypothetical protein
MDITKIYCRPISSSEGLDVNIVLLELSGTHSRMGNLFFATLNCYTKSPRKAKKSDENNSYASRTKRKDSYLSVGGNGLSWFNLK